MNQIYNPFLPLNEYIPDGEPHVFDGRVHLYGSHNKEGGKFVLTTKPNGKAIAEIVLPKSENWVKTDVTLKKGEGV